MKKKTEKASGVNVRELVLASLLEIRRGAHSHQIQRAVLEKYQYLSRQERAFYTRLCQGTLENTLRMDFVLEQFSSVPVRKMKPVIREILRMSVYQYESMDQVPDAAVANEAVKLAVRKGFSSLKGFVNGVLRRVMRDWDQIHWPGPEDPLAMLKVRYSMPEDLLQRWLAAYGNETTEKICAAFLQAPPLTVRFRTQGADPQETRKELEAAGVILQPAPYVENAAILEHVDYMGSLAAFREGRIFVQDVSSMLAVRCAGISGGDTVLDLCAAPGGKSLLAADLLQGSGHVTARDLTEEKTQMIRDNISRSGAENISAEVCDATVFDPEMKEKADVVLADLPCSGYGVIGRKPDIKLRASQENVRELQTLQRSILNHAFSYVKPGGVLLYSTCTITAEENQDNRDWILSRGEFTAESMDPFLPEELRSKDTAEGQLQLLPGIHRCDGFYVARFRKKA